MKSFFDGNKMQLNVSAIFNVPTITFYYYYERKTFETGIAFKPKAFYTKIDDTNYMYLRHFGHLIYCQNNRAF